MVTIGPSSNVLLPSPSFIGRIITSLRSRSEVTIGWWVDNSILEGTGLIVLNCSRPAWECFHHCPPQRSPLAVWSEGSDNEQASQALVVVKEQM
ncbi:hypothetical protein O181_097615 [Austropuccinia psidii MF-1]|uniref:Uncharacterized protein n=1 Tax=Austropuccinia psidii MF-1 TaxID=1389203 RepID=A0A9Q3PE48_9BASI|nr:hypothetical protein [Austropuccinia psidii MF-1]